MFFVIICNHLFVYFVKNISIIISSMDKWASWLKTIKRKIQDFMIWKFLWYKKFKVLKIYLAYWSFAKCLF